MRPIARRSLLLLLLLALPLTAGSLPAADPAAMAGWEKGSAYNRLYKAAEADRIKGEVTDIRQASPKAGMAPGVLIAVREGKSEEIAVHLCPVAYMDAAATGLRKGDKVKIRGAWAEFGGSDIFMAAKVKKGENFELKLRVTKDGTPFWSLTPEERAAHQQEAD
jgi:hypothetical protein